MIQLAFITSTYMNVIAMKRRVTRKLIVSVFRFATVVYPTTEQARCGIFSTRVVDKHVFLLARVNAAAHAELVIRSLHLPASTPVYLHTKHHL